MPTGRSRLDRAVYPRRNRVDRLLIRLKRYRRVVTRDEKRAATSLAMMTIAACLTWL
jgi:transposase